MPFVTPKITIRLSASITFKIVNQFPSLQGLTEGRLMLHSEHKIPHSFCMVYVDLQNLDGIDL